MVKMNNKYFFVFIILTSLFSIFMLSGCSGNKANPITGNVVANKISFSNKLEIYHFHATRQCNSCKTIGAYAEETINTYFKNEKASGRIIFDHINIDLPENKELVTKYKATGSSLWLGSYDKNGFHPEENVNVWYKIQNKQDYMNYLKELIEKRLAGDLS